MKSRKEKGAYDAPRVIPAMLQVEAALLAASHVLFVDIDPIQNMNDVAVDDEYFEVTF